MDQIPFASTIDLGSGHGYKKGISRCITQRHGEKRDTFLAGVATHKAAGPGSDQHLCSLPFT
jgi:hypothetical protein